MLDFVAGQLEMADPSQVKRYTERAKTRFEHQWEIRRAQGFSGFRRGLGGCWHPFRTQAGTLGDGTRLAYREFHG